jgi:hypothetical protein
MEKPGVEGGRAEAVRRPQEKSERLRDCETVSDASPSQPSSRADTNPNENENENALPLLFIYSTVQYSTLTEPRALLLTVLCE